MKNWILAILMSALLDSVLTSLPAPVNLFINSTNFHNVLCWQPGPGTLPETQYNIFKSVRGRKWKLLKSTKSTCIELHLQNEWNYYFKVQALYNYTLSAMSSTVNFSPYINTKISPPNLSLAGCGDCIKINISLPKAEGKSEIVDIQEYYAASFNVLWRKKKDVKSEHFTNNSKSFAIFNLERGMEYCVQVHMETRFNHNTEPSAWNCIFTSPVEQSKGPAVLGAISAVLIIGIILITVSIFSLHYTGCLCKANTTLPTGLNTSLDYGHSLIPERTVLDQIIVKAEKKEVKQYHNRTSLPDAMIDGNSETDSEGENENGTHLYMDRGQQLPSSETSCQASGDVLEITKPAASWDSEGLRERLSTEEEVCQWELDQGQNKADGHEDTWSTVVQDPIKAQAEEINEQEFQHFSDNVDLCSVFLAVLDAKPEEEEDSEQIIEDDLTENCLGPLHSFPMKWCQSDTDDLTKSFGTLIHILPEAPECEGMHEETDGEEEWESSGYLGH